MYGFKYVRDDLQRELLGSAQAEAVVFTVDPAGFIVVQSKDQHLRLEALCVAIDRRVLMQVWYFSSEALERYVKERDVNVARQVPFIEFETISDLRRAGSGAPPICHSYHLAIRNESSLPRGQRPWDRK